ncbi:aldose 1-epimerase [Propionispira arboris]|uniref:Aldose 1-epimerase n=1 Tax=Propionispira arboris TaxID=84035 RepID=A0A1H6Z3M6_9FIRM|nr:aldose epimerase family protein [Propionispira arboris]SEJ48018.1 aldose 1-epimerase [Propionispira arboris]
MITNQKIGQFKGKDVYAYTLTNQNGMSLTALNYGCVVKEILFMDKNKKKKNCVLSYKDFEMYEKNPMFLGATIGRVAGRIKNAECILPNGKKCIFEKNDGNQHLHGGENGFYHQFWNVQTKSENGRDHIIFTRNEKAHDGYPGNLIVCVSYTLDDRNTWTINYHVESDEISLCNMTNHSYFHLDDDDTIDKHLLYIDADQALEVDKETMATGKYLYAKTDPAFDFLFPREIGTYFSTGHSQLSLVGGGYDHAFQLNKKGKDEIRCYSLKSRIEISVRTTEEAVVVYTCNNVDPTVQLENGEARRYGAITLETQALPDRIHSDKPGLIIVYPDKPYDSQTTYTFSLI